MGQWLGLTLRASFWIVVTVGVVALVMLALTLVRERAQTHGIGLTLSTYGIQTFTRPKAWHLRAA